MEFHLPKTASIGLFSLFTLLTPMARSEEACTSKATAAAPISKDMEKAKTYLENLGYEIQIPNAKEILFKDGVNHSVILTPGIMQFSITYTMDNRMSKIDQMELCNELNSRYVSSTSFVAASGIQVNHIVRFSEMPDAKSFGKSLRTYLGDIAIISPMIATAYEKKK